MNKPNQKSIGREAAIALATSKWWEGKSAEYIAKRGMYIEELCLPFDVLHKAVEGHLGRPVFTHEFGSVGLYHEVRGEKDAPSLQEIFDLIPAEKRIVIEAPGVEEGEEWKE
jgi:hypothetical protein